ncbi:MAG TPA: ribbon-helix-helix protein, CopG family [Candidatus Limnocylindrales bacterium]|nr:ribbon-helix-helix protein, CopG family [Candidatus Limnocylindrales bacterium]
MPTRRTTILLDADLLERLERFARRERTTKTAVIGAAVEAYLAAHDRPVRLPFVALGRSEHGRLSVDGRSIVRRELGRLDRERPERPERPERGRG